LTARPWTDRRVRAIAAQAFVLAAIGALTWFLLGNLFDNLARRGITSGFGFLNSTAGFGVAMTLIDYTEQSTYGRAFFVGLLNTVLVSALGMVLATVLGFAVGIARLSRNWLVARLATAYVETIRNLPLLLQLFFWYFAVVQSLPGPRESLVLWAGAYLNNRGLYLPAPVPEPGFWWAIVVIAGSAALTWVLRPREARPGRAVIVGGPGIVLSLLAFAMLTAWETPALRGFNFAGGWVLIPELVALLAALTIYTAAFIAEVVRAGIESVGRGQLEAAAALGLTPRQKLVDVVIPQALRVIVPPLTNQYLNLTKNSSLAAAIAYPDLVSVFAGTVLNQTGQAVEVIAITMAVYLAISLAIAVGMNVYNRAIVRRGG
jgi:general L-amino acid transport system permease protein